MIEHQLHLRHLRGVEVFNTFDAFKRLEICKPSCRGGGPKITERSIKDSSENGGIRRFPISSPSWGTVIVLRIPYSPRCAVAFGTEGVVIEGEGLLVFTEVYVGFWSGGHKEKGRCRW